MKARVRTYGGFLEVEAWPTPCRYFVITKAVDRPGFTLTHTTTGMCVGIYCRSKKLLRLYAAILGGWNIPWGSLRTKENAVRVAFRSVPTALLRWRELVTADPRTVSPSSPRSQAAG